METKEIIIPQGWKIDFVLNSWVSKVKGNKIIYGNKRNHYPTRLGQGWKQELCAKVYKFPEICLRKSVERK